MTPGTTAAGFRRGVPAGGASAFGRSGRSVAPRRPPPPRHGLRRPPRRARAARLRYPEAAGAGPAHLSAGAGPGRGGVRRGPLGDGRGWRGRGPGGRREGGEAGPRTGRGGDPAPGAGAGAGEAAGSGSAPGGKRWWWGVWPARHRQGRGLGPGAAGGAPAPRPACPLAPREEGPVHRGRPDEPSGPHRQRLHPEGTAGAGAGGCPLPALPAHAPASLCSSTRWTSCTRWRAGRPSAPATSESPAAVALGLPSRPAANPTAGPGQRGARIWWQEAGGRRGGRCLFQLRICLHWTGQVPQQSC